MKPSSMRLAIAAVFAIAVGASAQERPRADIANAPYGPHERNIFDLWKAQSNTPTPIVLFFHGGGFTSGSKEKLSAKLLTELLNNGISVMAINYRLLPEAASRDPLSDCVRSIQFARLHSNEWNINPNRIGLTGSSAGAYASLWIAFRDDMADSTAPDPVLRQTTRVQCVAMYSGQTVMEPAIVRQIIGEKILEHSFFKSAAFGLRKDEIASPEAEEAFKAASPVTYLTPDDPPVWAYYSAPFGEPQNVSDAIHHPNFGKYLKERMERAKVECIVVHKNDGINTTDSCVGFLTRHLKN